MRSFTSGNFFALKNAIIKRNPKTISIIPPLNIKTGIRCWLNKIIKAMPAGIFSKIAGIIINRINSYKQKQQLARKSNTPKTIVIFGVSNCWGITYPYLIFRKEHRGYNYYSVNSGNYKNPSSEFHNDSLIVTYY